MENPTLDPGRHQASMEAFGRLCRIMDELREQCPWDRKQTLDSLRLLTIEETYELADALLEQDLDGVGEEIGDIMLHMVFYARIAEEKGAFDIAGALHRICEKLIQRHPHIYGDTQVADAEEVKQNWEKLKLQAGKRSVLGGVPLALPALVKAYRMQEKTAQVGFEWDHAGQVWAKVREELDELQEAIAGDQGRDRVEEEYGDVLFALVNYARFIGVDPETALERVNRKFKRRFEYIESRAGDRLQGMSLEEMDALWNEAKTLEPGKG